MNVMLLLYYIPTLTVTQHVHYSIIMPTILFHVHCYATHPLHVCYVIHAYYYNYYCIHMVMLHAYYSITSIVYTWLRYMPTILRAHLYIVYTWLRYRPTTLLHAHLSLWLRYIPTFLLHTHGYATCLLLNHMPTIHMVTLHAHLSIAYTWLRYVPTTL